MAQKARRRRNTQPQEAAKIPAAGSDVALAAAAGTITTPAPGPSTQTDASTTQTGSPIITEENPVVADLPKQVPAPQQPAEPVKDQDGSTWTPAAALAKQEPTTLAEADIERQKDELSRK